MLECHPVRCPFALFPRFLTERVVWDAYIQQSVEETSEAFVASGDKGEGGYSERESESKVKTAKLQPLITFFPSCFLPDRPLFFSLRCHVLVPLIVSLSLTLSLLLYLYLLRLS